ncbi:sigma-54-dependent Fis family transcriptional regulator [Nonomuraea rhizosphaerae]|uniref:sigma-54-dependent Fis family transcriptional regulator n=1 Tax=Nonomuraea rhizosphaerae TaxID=2665663 RepID=UPI001C5D6D84|nr:helix-turn-helix domain-containing protein [Nonomuraea rhizosphaerae]
MTEIPRLVAEARERFFEEGELDDPSVRATIQASWRRSQFFGVEVDWLDPPYQPDIEADTPLTRAARPVLDRLESALAGAAMSVILTDSRGRVVARRAGERSLNRYLDAIRLAVGFSYAEEYVGTNGIGTALEDKRLVHVFGSEHFATRLQGMSCSGAPIRHPISGRVEGVIDLTCRSVHASPLMDAFVQQAAADIARRLLEDSTALENALLREFLAANGRPNRAVVTLSDELTITNAAAAHLLEPADHEILRDKAFDLLDSARGCTDGTDNVVLSSGRIVRLRCRAVTAGAAAAGAVIEISVPASSPGRGRPAPVASAPLTGLAGHSQSWLNVCRQVETRCRARSGLLLTGEPGVGKLSIAEAAHRRCFPASHLAVADADGLDLELLGADLAEPYATVVIRHLDRLPAGLVPALAQVLEAAPTGAWLVGTSAAEAPDALLEYFPASLAVPPLRHRIDDVRELAPVLLRRHAGRRPVTCSPEAVQVLLRMLWPGNVAQLEEVLRRALSRRGAGEVGVDDLPEECHATTRRVLTTWEAVERDTVIAALMEAGGDKARAAAQLGISRATIYRKIHAYGIDLSP